MIPVSDAGTAH